MGMGLKLPIYEVSWPDVPRLLADSYGAGVQVLLADADPSAAVYHQVGFYRTGGPAWSRVCLLTP